MDISAICNETEACSRGYITSLRRAVAYASPLRLPARFAMMMRMIIDGKKIAGEIRDAVRSEIAGMNRSPRLDIVYAGENPVIDVFIRIKKRMADEAGAMIVEHRFPESISPDKLQAEIARIGAMEECDGLVVQLPLPKDIPADAILAEIPAKKDVDVLSRKAFERFARAESEIFPPVAGAVKEILDREKISLGGKRVVVLGRGRLVGEPIIAWLKREGVEPEVGTSTSDTRDLLAGADIVISGVGIPGLIKPDMLKEGAILIDAGTSEQAGKTAGDADPSCAERCSVFTPVPGGVGPITVAILFRNLVHMSMLRAEKKT